MWIVLREHGTITASPGLPTGLPLTAALDRAAAHAPPEDTRRYGIGLALVTDIIARHGGTVHARNRPEGGAVFTLNLPRVSKRTPKISRHPRH